MKFDLRYGPWQSPFNSVLRNLVLRLALILLFSLANILSFNSVLRNLVLRLGPGFSRFPRLAETFNSVLRNLVLRLGHGEFERVLGHLSIPFYGIWS